MIYFLTIAILDILSLLYISYDPYRQKFEWDIGEGFIHPIIIWMICSLTFPIVLIRTIYKRYNEHEAIKSWRKEGRCTLKIK